MKSQEHAKSWPKHTVVWHLQARILDCLRLHGAVFLGSVMFWRYVLLPVLTALLHAGLEPAAGSAWTSRVVNVFDSAYQVGVW